SHDRYFLDTLATEKLFLGDKSRRTSPGTRPFEPARLDGHPDGPQPGLGHESVTCQGGVDAVFGPVLGRCAGRRLGKDAIKGNVVRAKLASKLSDGVDLGIQVDAPCLAVFGVRKDERLAKDEPGL